MKKLLSVLLAAIMVFTIAPITVFAAKNGPKPGFHDGEDMVYSSFVRIDKFIDIDEPSEEYYLYTNDKVKKSKIDGASYDLETNTLTLKNVKNENYYVLASTMGDDFKIKLVGTNVLAGVKIFGEDGYSGNLTFTGSGKLTVNKHTGKKYAIEMSCYDTKCKLTVGKYVTLKLYGKKSPIFIERAMQSDKSKVISLANGDKNKLVRSSSDYHETVYVNGYKETEVISGYKMTLEGVEGDYTYVASESVFSHNNSLVDGYRIDRYVYSKSLGAYFSDANFSSVRLTEDELADYGYSFVTNSNGVKQKANFTAYVGYNYSYALCKDSKGTKYARTVEDEDEGVEATVYNIKKIPEFSNELYLFTENNKVKSSDLIGIYTSIEHAGKYNYTWKGDTYIYNSLPKPAKISKLTKGSKKITVKWKKVSTATGYEIQYSTSSKFAKKYTKTATVKKNSTTSKTIKKLKGKKKYYVRIRTYKTVSGKKYYSAWSKKASVTTKK